MAAVTCAPGVRFNSSRDRRVMSASSGNPQSRAIAIDRPFGRNPHHSRREVIACARPARRAGLQGDVLGANARVDVRPGRDRIALGDVQDDGLHAHFQDAAGRRDHAGRKNRLDAERRGDGGIGRPAEDVAHRPDLPARARRSRQPRRLPSRALRCGRASPGRLACRWRAEARGPRVADGGGWARRARRKVRRAAAAWDAGVSARASATRWASPPDSARG